MTHNKEIAVPDDRIRFGNLYLRHVIAFVNGTKVSIGNNDEGVAIEIDPDEKLMRFIEWEGSIQESGVNEFRAKLVEQYNENRMDLLYSKLGDVINFMFMYEKDHIDQWFTRYRF